MRFRLVPGAPLALLAFVLSASGCSDSADSGAAPAASDAAPAAAASGKATDPPGNAAAAPAAPSNLTLAVSADKTHAVQPGELVTVSVALGGAEPGEAALRYRVYLDDAGGANFLVESASPQSQVRLPEEMSDGSHELRVELVDAGGQPVGVTGSVLLIVYRL